jgi:hypothetical protein
MTELEQIIEWEKPEEVWWFDRWIASRPVTGPYRVVGEKNHLWVTVDGPDIWHIPKEDAYFTKRDALLAHYKHNEKAIKRERENLNERMRLLKKYYSEELYE